MAWRNMAGSRACTVLSALAVALGVAMIVAADVASKGVRTGVQVADATKDATAWMTDLFETSLNAVGVVILLAAGFVILNAFAMAVTQRRRQIGALRALGMTRRQVMRLILVEALLTGGAGTLLGLLAGPLLGNGLLALTRSLGVETGQGSVSLGSLALAIAMGVGITLISVLVPARRATRISPLVALRRESAAGVERNPVGRAVWGLLIVAGLVAYLVIAPPGEWALPPWDTIMPLALSILWAVGLLAVLPALIGWLGLAARKTLSHLVGATGRLVADNLRRGRRRVTLTVLAFAVGLTMIVSMTGIVTFTFTILFEHLTEGALAQEALIVVPFDLSSSNNLAREVAQFDLETLLLDREAIADFLQLAEGRAEIGEGYAVIAPEIGALVPNYPSFIYDLDTLSRGRFYTFVKGDWDTALPIMEAGCGLLLHPGVAAQNGVGIGDTITLQAVAHPIECTVAGLGAGGYHPASFISPAAKEAFDVTRPAALLFFPLPNTDRDGFEAELSALAEHHGVLMGKSGDTREAFSASGDLMVALMSNLLLLAVLAAAMGMVNTTAMSVAERQQELGLLRAVGATRRQTMAVVMGETALIGLVGGGLGLVAGSGISVIYAVATGGKSMGISDFPLWEAAWQATHPALLVGLLGLVTAPLICAGAAWLPVRSILRGSAVETLNPERQAESDRHRSRRGVGARLNRAPATWTLAWRNLEAHRTRTALSAIAVALGVAMIVATGVFQSGMRSAWQSGENKMAFLMEMGNVVFNGVGVIILVAAGFLIFNAFAMAVTQQRRQIGMLRSLGMTRRQVLRQVLAEALFTGGLGTLGGLLAGPLLGRGVLAAMRGMGAQVGHGSVAWGGVVLAAVMGMGITTLSALLPARRAARVSPLTALREQISKSQISKPHIFGGLILAMLFVYLIIAPPGDWSGRNPPWDWIMTLLLWGTWLTGLLLVIPALLAGMIRSLRGPLCRLAGTVGRLIGDNLARAPGRTTLTALTFAVGLMMMVGTAGVVSFSNDVLVSRLAANALGQTVWYIYPFNRVSGLGQLSAFDLDAPGIDDAVLQDVWRLAEGRAVVDESYLVVVPEISSPMPGFPSSVMRDVDRLARPGNFNLVEGDWETALPLLKEGCGLLITPAVAGRHTVSVGQPLTVTGLDGPVTCTVAAIGAGGFAPMAVIGPGGKDAFVAAGKPPDSLSVRPLPGADIAALEADLYALNEQYGDKAFVGKPEDELEAIVGTSDQLMMLFNGLVLLAVIAAALGTVNTTLMSVTGRRRELGLLRAVGATRRQITVVVMGETALTGLLGTVLGGIAGLGLGGIFALAYGGITFGLVDLPLWQAAGETVLPALRSGWLGLAMAPLLAAGAAFPAVRSILRGSAIETMELARNPKVFRNL